MGVLLLVGVLVAVLLLVGVTVALAVANSWPSVRSTPQSEKLSAYWQGATSAIARIDLSAPGSHTKNTSTLRETSSGQLCEDPFV